ncbi:MAG: hypothetical protein RML94_00620 [Bacteroidia bacterium]|nr:hypothetical protein [Bacteroidia bacterium]
MREACGGRASARCEAPCPLFHSCPGGGAQHRQPAARRPERSEGHAQNKNLIHKTNRSLYIIYPFEKKHYKIYVYQLFLYQ